MSRVVLIIDDSESARQHVKGVLEDKKLFDSVLTAADGLEGMRYLMSQPITLVLCDLFMPGMDGFKFLSLMRQKPELAETPVIMLTGHEDLRSKVKGLEAGAADYLVKPFDDSELVARVRVHLKLKALQDELRDKNNKLEALLRIDPLTQITNRRVLLEKLEEEVGRARRYHGELTFLLADIDNFKRLNDQFGHKIGDLVLSRVAGVFGRGLRQSDLAGRFGGEEFGLVLPETDITGAVIVAERCRAAVETQVFENSELQVTVSIGVISYDGMSTAAEMIERAEKALQNAKRSGKNRVVTG